MKYWSSIDDDDDDDDDDADDDTECRVLISSNSTRQPTAQCPCPSGQVQHGSSSMGRAETAQRHHPREWHHRIISIRLMIDIDLLPNLSIKYVQSAVAR